MKRILWIGILMMMLIATTLGCGPVTRASTFAGTWTTNIAKINFQQTGSEITGAIEGYGGGWNETFTGTVNENGEAVFNTTWFGDFTLVLDGNTFKSKSADLSFCGVRNSEELPAGCGFSGKWIVPANPMFPDGSYMVLKQVGENVTGNVFDGGDKPYDEINGKVEWGKGWRMMGTSTQNGDIDLEINAAETGFQIVYGSDFQSQLCAVREGQSSAYIMSFTCQP